MPCARGARCWCSSAACWWERPLPPRVRRRRAVVSPDGKRAAWPGDGRSVWNQTRASASAEWRDPERLLSIRGTVGKLVFSPDGKQLGFENPRGDHGFIAVYDLKANKIDYVDPSFGIDSGPVWSADGQMSFVRRIRGVADQPVTAPVPSFGPWSRPPVRTNDVFTSPRTSCRRRSPTGPRPPATAARSPTSPARRRPRDLLHALRHAVAPHRQLPERRRPRALAARDLARRRRGRVRARQLAEQRRARSSTRAATSTRRTAWSTSSPSRPSVPRLLGDGLAPAFTPDDSLLVWINGTT